tara:strand:+ start:10245 stop:10517 length:273 start_codon:yes stop_codon:yes gene_type:complete
MSRFYDKQYKQWIKNIFARDKYQCQWPNCKHRRTKLNAHHIKKWSDYPGLRFDLSNGITLCKEHHDLIKNNEENYEMFFFKIISNMRREK